MSAIDAVDGSSTGTVSVMEVGTSILLEICAVHESLFGTEPT
jgi:hypothetical protein